MQLRQVTTLAILHYTLRSYSHISAFSIYHFSHMQFTDSCSHWKSVNKRRVERKLKQDGGHSIECRLMPGGHSIALTEICFCTLWLCDFYVWPFDLILTNNDLVVPRARLRFGERAFSVAAPRLWNSLPVDIRNAATQDTFKKKLKTFMFYKHFLE